MRVQYLRTWLAVPLLLALPAVMALVSADEAKSGALADNSLHGKLPMNSAFDRNILGHEAYAAAAAEKDLELLDPEAGAPRDTPSPTPTTEPDDPIIVWPFPEKSTPDTTHRTTATGTVSATPSVSVSASHPTETSGGTATQSSRVPSSTGSPTIPDDTPTGPPRNSSATFSASATGPRRTGTISVSISGSTTITATASRPTGVSSRVTTAPPRSTMTTTPTTTTKATRTRTHKPSRTKTPWLPSSIEPVKPPKITATPSPGTSLPDVVIPNLKPKIPKDNFPVTLRFQQVSYYQVISNGILAAQLVNFIPAQLAPLLNVAEEKILVLAIRDGRSGGSSSSPPSRRARKRALVTTQDEDDSIRVVVSIPRSKYWALNELVSNRHSALYTPTANGFGQYLDWNYPLSNQPPPPVSSGSKGSNGQGGNHNPLTGDHLGAGDPDQAAGGLGSSNGAVTGSLIGLATVAYVGIALVVVRMVRRKKLREQEAQEKLSPKNISAPVRVQGGSQGWGWQGN
ncbi:hypothetical protein BGZ70_004281 [Mortierella alpina]|uniref:Mid2 domain-containing protein n=1 Tax=Mortierella alpina TaxID=64518 RepID=A0A9P6JA76_MORAP|nr:hypothetical protein BGZ70_004281 [Mortierella alpina]